jgi:pyridoxal phosphate enzyme (YggS family)
VTAPVPDAETITSNLAAVRSRLERAAGRVNRDPAGVRLIAISKTFPAACVRAAAAAGQRDFGENRVQEALPKIEATRGLGLRWHLVGHLQSNKVRKAAGVFDAVHSVDGRETLVRLDAAAQAEGRTFPVLLQVNSAREASKSGVPPEAIEALLDAAEGCRAVQVTGLMTIPPFFDDPEDARPWFRELRELRDRLILAGTPAHRLAELSMGMSNDFEVAVEEGATMVRVGTAIFGPRTGRST